MRYLSLFSGIEAATVAWEPLGWTPVAFAEIEPFPSALLAHHWPLVPNLGDVVRLRDALLLGAPTLKRAARHPRCSPSQAAWLATVAGLLDNPPDVLVGGSPCFTAGHMVLCAQGYKPIESVQVGDLVVTHTGRLCPVVRVGHEQKPVGILRAVGQPEGVRCTPDHPFLARHWHSQNTRRQGKYARIETIGEAQWMPAAEMPGQQWVALTRFGPSDVQRRPTPRLSVEQTMLMAGMYLGDGWLRDWPGKSKRVVMLGLNAAKYAHFQASFPDLSHNLSIDRSCYRVTICDTRLANWLETHFGRGSHHKRIPAWVLSDPNRQYLLDGYRLTDGSMQGGVLTINSVSRALAFGVRDLAQTLACVASVGLVATSPTTQIEGRTVQQSDYWQVRIFPAATSRKSRQVQDHLLRSVQSFSPDGDAMVFNIEVAEDHSYILDGMVVHNCQAFSLAGARRSLEDARGNLTLIYAEIVHAINPRFVVWENVPGVFSTKDNAFGHFLAALVGADAPLVSPKPKRWGRVGVVDGPLRSAAWRVLDAQFFGVPQRRRRVFLLSGRAGDRIHPANVLFEPEGLQRDSVPRRQSRQTPADTAGTGAAPDRGAPNPHA